MIYVLEKYDIWSSLRAIRSPIRCLSWFLISVNLTVIDAPLMRCKLSYIVVHHCLKTVEHMHKIDSTSEKLISAHFLSDCIVFNENSIASIIAELSQC